MARSSSGKSVARAAATGGGTTYRGQMPVNWYAALLVIVIVGIASVALAKYNYDKGKTVVQPAVGTVWHAALAFDICGTSQQPLAASPKNTKNGLTTTGNGVVDVAPQSASQAGNNATLGNFVKFYPGLTLTDSTIKYPGALEPAYSNGQKCAKGTPDAGKVGEVQARSWLLSTKTGKNGKVTETGGVTTLRPTELKFANRQLITVGFAPKGTTLPKPPAKTILALVQVLSGSQPVATTTTTTPGATTTTGSSTTPSSAPTSTSTTAPPSTTTPSTTTTTAPSTTTTKPSTTTTK